MCVPVLMGVCCVHSSGAAITMETLAPYLEMVSPLLSWMPFNNNPSFLSIAFEQRITRISQEEGEKQKTWKKRIEESISEDILHDLRGQ